MVVVRTRTDKYQQNRSVMPQLEPAQYSKFSQMLSELEPVLSSMKEAPRNFVTDQIERNRQYGERTLVSTKQFAWLERLHEEFIGDTDHGQERDDDPRSDRDMNDDIPF